MPDFRPVYSDEGDTFSLRIDQRAVSANGRSWVQNRVVVQDGKSGVVVIPVCEEAVAFIRIHRPVVDRELLELPRGLSEGETEDDAQRELLEETGLAALSLRHLGRFILDSGLVPTEVAAFEARVDRSLPRGSTDGEASEVVWVERAHVLAMIRNADLEDAITLSALMCWFAVL